MSSDCGTTMKDMKRETLTERLALLCRLLSEYFAVCPPDTRGLIESCFFDVWKMGIVQAGSVLSFYNITQMNSADFARLREEL